MDEKKEYQGIKHILFDMYFVRQKILVTDKVTVIYVPVRHFDTMIVLLAVDEGERQQDI